MQVVSELREVARPESEALDETFTEGTLLTQMFSKAGEIVELRLMHDKAGGPKVGCSRFPIFACHQVEQFSLYSAPRLFFVVLLREGPPTSLTAICSVIFSIL
jgi:hypothetical protein